MVVGDPGAGFAETARRHGANPVAEPRPGYGRACLAGLRHLAVDPPDVVVFLRGDGGDDPEELPAVLSPLLSPGADFVMGSRSRGQPDPGAYPTPVRLGNRIATGLIRCLYGYRYTDLGSFRAIRWNAISRLGLSDPDYGWLAEMQVNAARVRIPAVEVPVSARRAPSAHGRSESFAGSLVTSLKILLTVLQPRGAAAAPDRRAT